jgi:hypothetical protein
MMMSAADRSPPVGPFSPDQRRDSIDDGPASWIELTKASVYDGRQRPDTA